MHIFVNAIGASAGGGLTYLRHMIPRLGRLPNVRATVWITRQSRESLFPNWGTNHLGSIQFIEHQTSGSVMRRFLREQINLPRLLVAARAHVLLSTGNFALRNSPVPQILLSRNALYTSERFYSDLLTRREYRLWLAESCKRLLARRSIHWANSTIAPSLSFAQQLRIATGKDVAALHHGFDRNTFFAAPAKMSETLRHRMQMAQGSLRLLLVSHYNYFRNFETLLRALPLIREKVAPTPVRLFLTCHLGSGSPPGQYHSQSAAKLVRELGITDDIVELGAVPYDQLHHLYRASDIYVSPAYAESFAHPLVEAMASGVPVVASDLPIHREICRDAALYFSTFSPELLAGKVLELAKSAALHKRLADAGIRRAMDFSWEKHVEQLVAVAESLVSPQSQYTPAAESWAHAG